VDVFHINYSWFKLIRRLSVYFKVCFMDVYQAILTALNIMLLGMFCVFTFLGVLILAVKSVAYFYSVNNEVVLDKPKAITNNNTDVIAAITTAIYQYRKSRCMPHNKYN
jgi:Na+-transporting methylmalonyl-CoA/oxaloacetate decarboxylase gamma subunit